MTAISDLLTKGGWEMLAVGVFAIALIVAMMAIDKLIHGEDASNSWKHRDDR